MWWNSSSPTPTTSSRGRISPSTLPFRHAPEGGEPFPETPLGFTPWRHQRDAFNRLSRGQSTVIATGTGSGKTECFLYPVLDHCRAQAGAAGVKAIVIYPMNALASDQARRIAGIVDRTPSLHGKVTAGLYVGETGASPRQRMGADHVIENREVLRERPPDILLTNYKMLDLLLTRPVDFPLWRHNAAGVLRYLVVDELHTFDGAQGTDLACLIRRLRVRLQADELVCVGTSATIGGDEYRSAIVDYVSEDRHGVEALAGSRRSWYQTWVAKVLEPVHHLAATRDAADVLHVVMHALRAAGLVSEIPARRAKVWALDPGRLYVTAETTVMHCEKSKRTLVVPAREAELWQGVPCLDRAAQDS